MRRLLHSIGIVLAIAVEPVRAEPGDVLTDLEISGTSGGFTGVLHDDDRFGRSVAWLGDLDGNGTIDLAVGADGDDADDGQDTGAVWILLLAADGSVLAHHEIDKDEPDLAGEFAYFDFFGLRIAPLGDFDGDGVVDLAVGKKGGNPNLGRVLLLFLETDGTVKAHTALSAPGAWEYEVPAIAPLGDFDGDGVPDLAVGSVGYVHVLSIVLLNPDGSIKSRTDTDIEAFGFPDGSSIVLTAPGDIDGDGVDDLVLGNGSSDGNSLAGSVWVLFLEPSGALRTYQKIDANAGGFTGQLEFGDQFGRAVAAIDDLDGDGRREIAVGAPGDDDGSGNNRGAIWILFLAADGTVREHQKISGTEGDFDGDVQPGDHFGCSLAWHHVAVDSISRPALSPVTTAVTSALPAVRYGNCGCRTTERSRWTSAARG